MLNQSMAQNRSNSVHLSDGGIFAGESPLATPLAMFLVQAAIIITISRLIHLILGRIGQPRVVSEIIGGVCLGPSALGNLPGFSATIFPKHSLPALSLVANVGLVFYLFIVGLELEPEIFFGQLKKSVTIATAGIVIPFVMGGLCSWGLYEFLVAEETKSYVSIVSFSLFIGVAMTITAFPVLARILNEKKLLKSPLGTMTVSAAAMDDVMAWILLALVISILKSSSTMSSVYILSSTVGLSLILLLPVRLLLNKMADKFMKIGPEKSPISESAHQMITAFVFVFLFLCSWITEFLGIHAIFGGFLLGLTLPRKNRFNETMIKRLEDIVVIGFLPLFFASSGLKTNIGLLSDFTMIIWLFIVLLVACVSKIFGCTITGKIMGVSWSESLAIGIMMNARGLIELIVLNIGYDINVIDPKVFLIFVIMALVTTFMTAPLLNKALKNVEICQPVETQNSCSQEGLTAQNINDQRMVLGDIVP